MRVRRRQRCYSSVFDFSTGSQILSLPTPYVAFEGNLRHLIILLCQSVAIKKIPFKNIIIVPFTHTHTPQVVISSIHCSLHQYLSPPVIFFVYFLITGLSKFLLIHRSLYKGFFFSFIQFGFRLCFKDARDLIVTTRGEVRREGMEKQAQDVGGPERREVAEATLA